MTPRAPALPLFAIPLDSMQGLRRELQGLTDTQDERGRVCLDSKDELSRLLRGSPDLADCLIQGFAFRD